MAGREARIRPESLAALRLLQRGRDWLWVTGNHDPQIGRAMGGESAAAIALAGVTLRHEPDAR